MSCTRNLVMQSLVAWFDAQLKNCFTEKSTASRDLARDPSGVLRAATPSLRMIETGSQLFPDNQYWSDMEVSATLVVNLRASKEWPGLIQDLLNEAEAACDACLKASFKTQEGIPFSVRPDGMRRCYPGTTGEGQLEYPLAIRFTRQEVM